MTTSVKGFRELLLFLTIVVPLIYLFLWVSDGDNHQVLKNFLNLPPPPRYVMVDDDKLAPKNKSLIYSLFFNKFHGASTTWGLAKNVTSPEDLQKVNCSHTNCIFTYEKNLLPNIHDFDVVFINSWWEKDLPLPATRHPKQIYVFSNNEWVYFWIFCLIWWI